MATIDQMRTWMGRVSFMYFYLDAPPIPDEGGRLVLSDDIRYVTQKGGKRWMLFHDGHRPHSIPLPTEVEPLDDGMGWTFVADGIRWAIESWWAPEHLDQRKEHLARRSIYATFQLDRMELFLKGDKEAARALRPPGEA
jgi:hypothetical protein